MTPVVCDERDHDWIAAGGARAWEDSDGGDISDNGTGTTSASQVRSTLGNQPPSRMDELSETDKARSWQAGLTSSR
jgi:hypothetical protein